MDSDEADEGTGHRGRAGPSQGPGFPFHPHVAVTVRSTKRGVLGNWNGDWKILYCMSVMTNVDNRSTHGPQHDAHVSTSPSLAIQVGSIAKRAPLQ